MWHYEAPDLAHESPYDGYGDLSHQWCANRNGEFDTGHKNIKTTQIYAKITKEKLNKDMDKLSLQLNHIEEYMGHVEQSVENDKSNQISKQDEV